MKPLLIYGAGGHGKCVIEAAQLSGQKVNAVLDDSPHADELLGVPIVRASEIRRDDLRFYRFVVAIGQCATRREKYLDLLNAGATPETIIHPRAYVSPSAKVGRGSVVLAMAQVDASAAVGDNCIVNVGAGVGHDCLLANHSHVAGHAALGGGVHVGEGAWVGIGATIKELVGIGEGALVAMAASVSHDVPAFHKAISPHRREAMILPIV